MIKSEKYGSFKVYVDGVFLMVWPVHFENPTADIEIVSDVD